MSYAQRAPDLADPYGAGKYLSLSADGGALLATQPYSAGYPNTGSAIRALSMQGGAWVETNLYQDLYWFNKSVSGTTSRFVVGLPDSNLLRYWKFTGYSTINSAGNTPTTTESLVSGDEYGFAVYLAANGATLAVGAPGTSSAKGAFYVFTWNGSTWTQKGARVVGSTRNYRLGESVALSADGNTLFVASPATKTGGTVYVYTWSGSAWTQTGSLADPSPVAGSGFGAFLSVSEDLSRAAVSTTAGEAILFANSGGSWSALQTLTGVRQGVSLSADGAYLCAGQEASASSGTIYSYLDDTLIPSYPWSAVLVSGPSGLAGAWMIGDLFVSAALSSGPSQLAASVRVFLKAQGALGFAFGVQGITRARADRQALLAWADADQVPARRLSLRKTMTDPGSLAIAEAVQLTVPYAADRLAAAAAAASLTLSLRQTWADGTESLFPLGVFSIQRVRRGDGDILIDAQRSTEAPGAVADVRLARTAYESTSSIRAEPDFQLCPGGTVIGQASAVRCTRITITLDGAGARSMEVLGDG